jgi:hypothetical protein
MPSSLVDRYQRFEGNFCLLFQVRGFNTTKKLNSAIDFCCSERQ